MDGFPTGSAHETMWSEHAEREIHYFVCDDDGDAAVPGQHGDDSAAPLVESPGDAAAPGLVHPRSRPEGARRSSTCHPCRVAISALQRSIGLDSYVKTSGSTGLHVLLPLGRQCTYEQSRQSRRSCSRGSIASARLPEIATITRSHRANGARARLRRLPAERSRPAAGRAVQRSAAAPAPPFPTPLPWNEVRHPAAGNARQLTLRSASRASSGGGDATPCWRCIDWIGRRICAAIPGPPGPGARL